MGQGPTIIKVSQSHSVRHTTLGRTPLDVSSARRRDLYLKTHNTSKIQTSLPPAGFEPALPANERPKIHALDRATTGVGSIRIVLAKFSDSKYSGHCSYFRTPVCTVRSSNNYITIHRRKGRETYYLLSSGHKTSMLASVFISCCCVMPRTNLPLPFENSKIHYRVHKHQNTAGDARTPVSWRCSLVVYYNGGIFARRREGALHGGNRRLIHKFSVLSVWKGQGIEKLRIEEVNPLNTELNPICQ